MSAYTMNYSEELWGTDARTFNPDRWLDGKGKSLDQHMSSFSKGVRSCIGQKLVPELKTLKTCDTFAHKWQSCFGGSHSRHGIHLP